MTTNNNHEADTERRYYRTPEQFVAAMRSTRQMMAAVPAAYWRRVDVTSHAFALIGEAYDHLETASQDGGDGPLAGEDGWPTDDDIAGLLHAVRVVVLEAAAEAWGGKALAEGRWFAARLSHRLRESDGT